VVQWFGTNTDVDELKQMEESLRAPQARLNSTLAAGSIGTWTWDKGFRLQVPVLRARRRALAQPSRRNNHQPITTERLAALGALIQPHADAGSRVVEDGSRLFAPHR
jgi:hypothetical protein